MGCGCGKSVSVAQTNTVYTVTWTGEDGQALVEEYPSRAAAVLAMSSKPDAVLGTLVKAIPV